MFSRRLYATIFTILITSSFIPNLKAWSGETICIKADAYLTVRFRGLIEWVDASPQEPSKSWGDWGVKVLEVFEGSNLIKVVKICVETKISMEEKKK